MAELEALREHARLIRRLYLPTPGRDALLRANAVDQARLRGQLLAMLEQTAEGPLPARPRFGGSGALAPGWHLEF